MTLILTKIRPYLPVILVLTFIAFALLQMTDLAFAEERCICCGSGSGNCDGL